MATAEGERRINTGLSTEAAPQLTLPTLERMLLHQLRVLQLQQLLAPLQKLHAANGWFQLLCAPLTQQPIGRLLPQHIVVALVRAKWIVITAHLSQLGGLQIPMSATCLTCLHNGVTCQPCDARLGGRDDRMYFGGVVCLKGKWGNWRLVVDI